MLYLANHDIDLMIKQIDVKRLYAFQSAKYTVISKMARPYLEIQRPMEWN